MKKDDNDRNNSIESEDREELNYYDRNIEQAIKALEQADSDINMIFMDTLKREQSKGYRKPYDGQGYIQIRNGMFDHVIRWNRDSISWGYMELFWLITLIISKSGRPEHIKYRRLRFFNGGFNIDVYVYRDAMKFFIEHGYFRVVKAKPCGHGRYTYTLSRSDEFDERGFFEIGRTFANKVFIENAYNLSFNDMRVLLYLYRVSHGYGSSFVGLTRQQIQSEMGISQQVLCNCIKHLCDANLITEIGASSYMNYYYINTDIFSGRSSTEDDQTENTLPEDDDEFLEKYDAMYEQLKKEGKI